MLKKLKLNSFMKTTRSSRTNTSQKCPFHQRGQECKCRKSRDTWGNQQIWPWSTKWSRSKVNRVNTLVIANTIFKQDKRRFYTWTSPDGQYQHQTDYVLFSHRWRNSIESAKIRSGADCDSDYELLIAKFRPKLKKVGKTTRPFRYDLNQIPYDYTVELRNRFKGWDLVDRVPEELWMEVRNIVQEEVIKTILK